MTDIVEIVIEEKPEEEEIAAQEEAAASLINHADGLLPQPKTSDTSVPIRPSGSDTSLAFRPLVTSSVVQRPSESSLHRPSDASTFDDSRAERSFSSG